MKKKITRISLIVLLLLAALLIALPFLMERKVAELLRENVNNNINGQFDFSEMTLSLYKEFPVAYIELKDVHLINAHPFTGDTLAKIEHLDLRIGIGEFFQGDDDPMEIEKLNIEKAGLFFQIDVDEQASYDVVKESAEETPSDKSEKPLVLTLKSYEIKNSKLIFQDASSNYGLKIEKLNHSGNGSLSSATSELQTLTQAVVSYSEETTKYLDRNNFQLDGLLNIDLGTNTYTFKENKATINRLPFTFEGFIRLGEDTQEYDMVFQTISSDFKNFLALIPEKYSKDISDLQTQGNFDIAGQVKGFLSENTIPAFKIELMAHDASFKYPELPKKVEHIYLDAVVENKTGSSNDTQVLIDKLAFQVERDTFELNALITNLGGNTAVNSRAKGTINLDDLSRAYPVPESFDMAGILSGDIRAEFNQEAIEKKRYKDIDLSGDLNIQGLNYAFEALPNPLKVHTLTAEFNPKRIEIEEVAGITGDTDFTASGNIYNALGFFFNEEVLKGSFDVKSNSLVVADLVEEDESGANDTSDTSEEAFKIPASLDISMDALVGKVVYDNIVMYDLAGNLRIKDQQITFKEISSRMLDGRMIFDGWVATKDEKPSFKLALNMSNLNIANTFNTIELMEKLSPAAKALNGKLSTNMALSGELTDQLDLDFNSLTGNLLAEVLTAKISPEESPAMNLLDNKLGFVAFDKLDLSGLKTALSFENGKVQVKPFKVRYEDISIEVSGGHSFASNMDYKLTMDVPARYLGDDVNKLLSSIDDESLEELSVPVIANIEGSYGNPQFKTDLKSQVKDLTDQLVDIQKKKYINKGKNQVNDLLGNVLTQNTSEESEETTEKSDAVKLTDVLGNSSASQADSLGNNASKKSADKVIKEKAKGILGNLLNSKTKAVTSKDTIN